MSASRCATCDDKTVGTLICSGCKQAFCTNHVKDHRHILSKQMEDVTVEHDQLRQNIAEFTDNPLSHPLMAGINEWEEEEIKTIREIADECRNQVKNAVTKSKDNIMDKIESLTQELQTCRADDNFVETDLKRFNVKLEKLKKKLFAPPTVKIIREFDDTSYINKLFVFELSDDIFEELIGNISIQHSGKVITHGFLPSYGAVRGKVEYSLGCHQIRFRMENLSSGNECFFGIISQTASMHSNPSCAPSVYGWTDSNSVYLNGIQHKNYKEYKSDMRKGDIFELLINCDRHRIRLKNTRTNKTHELSIDVMKCPLPWQLNFSLGYWGDSVRLLSR